MTKPDVRRTCSDCGEVWTVPGPVAQRRPSLGAGRLLTGLTSLLAGVGGQGPGQRRLRTDALSGGSAADGLRDAYAVCGHCGSDRFIDAAVTT